MDTGGSSPVPIAVAIADALHETAFLVGQRLDPLASHLVQQLIQPALVGLPTIRFRLGLALGPALPPALPPALFRLARSRRRLVALQTGIALGKIVAEHRVLPPMLQQ